MKKACWKARYAIEGRGAKGKLYPLVERVARLIENIVYPFLGKDIVECFGDSHSRVFRYMSLVSSDSLIFRSIVVQGATARSLRSSNSRSRKAFSYFRKSLRRDLLITCFGEVDCGANIFVLQKSRGIGIDELIDESVSRYVSFLEDEKSKFRNIVVLGVINGWMEDAELIKQSSSIRRELAVKKVQIDSVTDRYNRKLERECNRIGLNYFDINKFLSLYDPVSLKNVDVSDHHMNRTELGSILARHLSPFCKILVGKVNE